MEDLHLSVDAVRRRILRPGAEEGRRDLAGSKTTTAPGPNTHQPDRPTLAPASVNSRQSMRAAAISSDVIRRYYIQLDLPRAQRRRPISSSSALHPPSIFFIFFLHPTAANEIRISRFTVYIGNGIWLTSGWGLTHFFAKIFSGTLESILAVATECAKVLRQFSLVVLANVLAEK